MSEEVYAGEPAPHDGDPSAGGGPTAYRIERVTDANLADYRAVRLAMLLDAPRAFGSTYAIAARLTDEEWLRRVANGPTWLAWDTSADRPVGSIAMYRHDGCADGEVALVGMWVAAPARGKGVADDLVETVLAAARGAGHARVSLDVAAENIGAQRLYVRRGFRPTGRVWVNEAVDGGVEELEFAIDL